jgi:hypothetical protein
VPRIINVICDATLVFGYAEERHQIDVALVREVLGELEVTGVLPADSRGQPAPALVPAPQFPPVSAPSVPPRTAEPAAVVSAGMQEQALARAVREAADRAAGLDARERLLAQRERELAEQRRVLAEEYRLLRGQRMQPAGGATRAPAGHRLSLRSDPAVTRFAASRPEGLRGWLKRLLSPSQRALEEN